MYYSCFLDLYRSVVRSVIEILTAAKYRTVRLEVLDEVGKRPQEFSKKD